MTDRQNQQWPYPGARWWKFDFHTHTPASKDTPWHRLIGTEKELTPEKWLQRYMDKKIDCVAVTDHNSGAWIDKLKEAYKRMREEAAPGFRELHLFPGVEISVNGGFHLLAIFDKGKTQSAIDDLLAKTDYDGVKGDSNEVTGKSPAEVIDAVLKAGGIPIPAHVDGDKGLLRAKEDNPASLELDANTVRQVLKNPGVLAMEVIDPSKRMPQTYEELGLSWSKVLGSDCHNFRGENLPGDRYTWVKMGEPSLEGLRLALHDGAGFSIRRSDDEPFDPFALPEHFTEKVEIFDARYMGNGAPARLAFSPWLNALVGGRGTGKSTVVHAMRFAAGREHELTVLGDRSEPRLTFERFNRESKDQTDAGGLTEETRIQWTVMRDGVRYRVIWLQDGDSAVVEEDAGGGNWKPSSIRNVEPAHFPIRIFSQGQIAELAGEKQQALLQIIDEAAGTDALQKNQQDAKNEFRVLQARLRKLSGELDRRKTLVVDRQDIERKLKRLEEAGYEDVLKNYQRRIRQRREIGRQFEAAEKAARRIEEAADEAQPENIPDGLFDKSLAEDREAAEIAAAAVKAMDDAAEGLRAGAQRLRETVGTQREKLKKSSWQAAAEQSIKDYEALKESGVSDPSEYGRLVQERQRLDEELKRLDSTSKESDRLRRQAELQLEKVLNARRKVSAKRYEFLEQSLTRNDFVRIQCLPYGHDPRVIERSLRETLHIYDSQNRFESDILEMEGDRPKRGLIADLLKDLPDDLEPRREAIEERVEKLKQRIRNGCAGNGDFSVRFNNYLERKRDLLDDVLTWFPEDGLEVEYSRSGDGRDFQPIGQASAGQRAAAMLAFLLAHGEEPLVMDQPEDDLDNHLIYDLIVRQIRENKFRRQIVVVTHNPNIVVNGDAEMLHALDFGSGQCRVKQSGSLQEKGIRDEVCRVMEGGREAFARRYRRLGQEPTDVR